MYLPNRTILNNRYEVEAVLGHGGFGITYAAYDQSFGARVAIKEYLPRHLATRGEGKARVSVYSGEARRHFDYGLKKFMEEAQLLAQFAHHPNVVSARDYFEANGTAYMVMEYAEGVTLKEYLEKKGGRISFEEARGIMMPVMDALREVHQVGLLHRDISPDNIYITTAAQVRVIDFGAARYFAGEQSKSLSVILKSGYAPEEQYRSSGHQGPWTDVYAVGATLYKLITGQTPPDALDRMAGDTLEPPSRLGVSISPPAERALLQALAVNASQRFQSMGEFQQAFLGVKLVPGQVQSVLSPLQPASEASYTPGAAPVSPLDAAAPDSRQPSSPSPYHPAPRRSANPGVIAAGIGAGVLGLVLLVVLVWRLVVVPHPSGDVTPPKGGGKKPVISVPGPPFVEAPTPPRKETPPVPQPVKTRFSKAKDGIITDSATGLEWYAGPNRDTEWNQAKSWTASLTEAGGGWRMPTVLELKAIYQKGAGPNNMDPIFQMNGYWVWTGQMEYASSAWVFHFSVGREGGRYLDFPYSGRAFAVRSRQRNEVGSQTEDLRREDVEKLAEKIRSAHLNKDINKWLGCYSSSYPHLGQMENRQLELWKNYDIKEVSYRISNVQRVNDKEATAHIVWNIQLYDHRTHDYTLVRQSYKIVLEKGPGGWKIANSKEIGGMPVAPAMDGALMSMEAFTPIVQGYDSIRAGKYDVANNHFAIAVKRDHHNSFALNNLAVLKEREGELNDALIFFKDASLHANKYLDKVTQTCFGGGGSLAAKPLREKGDRSSIAPIIRENINKMEAKVAYLEEQRLKEVKRKEKQRLGEEERQRQAEAKREELRRNNEEKKREAEKREAEERERQQKLQAEQQLRREEQRQRDEERRRQAQLEQQRRMEEQQQQAQKIPSPDPSTSTQKGRAVFYVRSKTLKFRACAGMDCQLIGYLEINEEVEKLGQVEQWAQVRVKRSGQIGWVDSSYLSGAPVAQY